MKKIMLGLCIIMAAMSLTACQRVWKQADTGGREVSKEEGADREKEGRENTNPADPVQKTSQSAGKVSLEPPGKVKTTGSAHGAGTPGKRAAAALEQALIKGQTFQIGSDSIGSGYGEIYCFLEDGSYYWFASQFGSTEPYPQLRRTVFQSGTWRVEPAIPHGEIKPEEYTELLLTQPVVDTEVGGQNWQDPMGEGWFLEGAFLTRESLRDEDWQEISLQSGTVYISGDPAYPVSIPLTNNPDMYLWLKNYAVRDAAMVNGTQGIGIDMVYDQVNAVSQPVAEDGWQGSYKASDYSALGDFINGTIRDIGSVGGEMFRQSQISGEKPRTAVYYEIGYVAYMMAELDELWEFTLVKGTEACPYVVFNGTQTTTEGLSTRVTSMYVYVKETGNFVKYLDGVCSETLGILEAAGGQDKEVWFLYHDPANLPTEGDALFPLNLRTGKMDYGCSVDTEMNLLGIIGIEGTYQYVQINAWQGNPSRVLELRHVTTSRNTGETTEEIWYLDTESLPRKLSREP